MKNVRLLLVSDKTKEFVDWLKESGYSLGVKVFTTQILMGVCKICIYF